MPAVARVQDQTAGVNIGGQDTNVYCNGILVQLLGDPVTAHAPCHDVPVHCSATHVQASETVFIGGIGVVRVGDQASCGHASTQGSDDVFADDNG